MSIRTHLTATALLTALTLPFGALADDIETSLQAALDAYRNGDMAMAREEAAFAMQLLDAQKADSLSGLLPPAPSGWQREINTDMDMALSAFGGGAGAEAEYSNGSDSFTITFMADNPMVASMAMMLSNPMIAGRPMRIAGQKFASPDGNLMTFVGNRVLVQAEGADADVMRPALEVIDYDALAQFGQ